MANNKKYNIEQPTNNMYMKYHHNKIVIITINNNRSSAYAEIENAEIINPKNVVATLKNICT